jgi:hypothetical protein
MIYFKKYMICLKIHDMYEKYIIFFKKYMIFLKYF